MSVYKKLRKQDTFISDYQAKKTWTITGDLLTGNDIEILRGDITVSPQESYIDSVGGDRYPYQIYDSVRYAYYADLPESYDTLSGSRDLSLQSTSIYYPRETLGDTLTLISIPRSKVGINIVPGSLLISYSADNTIYDSGEGKVKQAYRNLSGHTVRHNVGDILYDRGLIIITDAALSDAIFAAYSEGDAPFVSISWKSNVLIHTYTAHCNTLPQEFNTTFNPSANSGSNGVLYNNVTGSAFTPFVTSIGLYNEAQELIAVAKPNRPIPKSQDIDMTFVVQIDL